MFKKSYGELMKKFSPDEELIEKTVAAANAEEKPKVVPLRRRLIPAVAAVLVLALVLTVLLIHLVILTGTVMHFDAAAFPAATPYSLLSGEWADAIETYLTQHLGFHDTLFRIKSRADLFVGEKMIQGVYITDDEDVQFCIRAFDQLRAVALGPTESQNFIRARAEELHDEH